MGDAHSLKYWQAVNTALIEEMERDEAVVYFGQDVAKAGGTFGESRSLLETFGPGRVRDTPISELASVGAAAGAAMAGLRPVVEILYLDFLTLACDQLINQAAKIPYFSDGQLPMPLVVKTGVGTLQGMGAQHSQALEGWYASIPGLKVCWPATAGDAKAMMKAAIREEGPVLLLESFALLTDRGPVGDADSVAELGVADLAREGGDVTLVTWGTMRRETLAAAELLTAVDVSAEVLDLRTIVPWDRPAVFESVARTNRCAVVTEAVRDFGPSGEIAAAVGEECFDELDAPVKRIASPHISAPQYVDRDEMRLPTAATIAREVTAMLGVAADGAWS